jgi:tRNA 2-thiouridine synthesizing protein D
MFQNAALDRGHSFPETFVLSIRQQKDEHVLVNGQFNVKFLIIVNESPWGSSLAVTALRLARALVAAKAEIVAVFFRGDGIYHAQRGRVVDSGTPGLFDEWQSLAEPAGIPLLVCSSAAQRRMQSPPDGCYREAGLVELVEIMASTDRVVTF